MQTIKKFLLTHLKIHMTWKKEIYMYRERGEGDETPFSDCFFVKKTYHHNLLQSELSLVLGRVPETWPFWVLGSSTIAQRARRFKKVQAKKTREIK